MNETNPPLVLLADDQQACLDIIGLHVKRWGYRVGLAADKAALLRCLNEEQPAALLLDLEFGQHDGVEILQELLQQYPQLRVIMVTGHGTIDNAVAAMKLGAFDFVSKPVDFQGLKHVLGQATANLALVNPAGAALDPVHDRDGNTVLWGASANMVQLRKMIDQIAPTDATVLVRGESGTGKELVGRLLHQRSGRQAGPFVPINMAALPRHLVESTLFGHEKGAFTGADKAQIGCCQYAHQGTLFLDEIGEMDLDLQAKLLRFLQDRMVQRVGSNKAIPVDARIVAATNRDLLERVRRGEFREDLYYRLDVVQICVPALKHRREDIPLLANRFLQQAAAQYRKSFRGFSPAAMEALVAHEWPGNVRQLENLVKRLAILQTGPEIRLEDLPDDIRQCVLPAAAGDPFPCQSASGKQRTIDQIEKQAIVEALDKTAGNVKEAAQLLGLGPATIYRKLRSYSIVLPRQRHQQMVASGVWLP